MQHLPRSVATEDALETLPAPHASGSVTVVPARRDEELRDMQAAVRRLLLLGSSAWPFFFLVDLLGARADGASPHTARSLGLRLVGSALGLGAYAVVRQVELRASHLRAIDAAVFVIGTALLTLIAIPFGGLTSRFVQGIIIFVFARAALIPSHWKQAAGVSLASAFTLPLTMAVASAFDPALRAQWTSASAVLILAHNGIFVLSAAVIGSAGSHLVWMARKQVHELRKLGIYRLRRRIGFGGASEVWLAWQDPPGREVALKVLKDVSLDDPDGTRRFEREARAAIRLSHPNTIRVLDFGTTDDGVRYIAMERLKGLDLDALVKAFGPMPPARAIYLARQACGSLTEAHKKNVIHRDLKPANIFITRADDGADLLKVLDFGLARIGSDASASSPSPLTPEGIICGTPAFISPEAVSGERTDARSDLYSLGAVLYFMVTGTVVFPHLTVSESLLAHAGRKPEPPSRRAPDVPADLERIILRCLEKRPIDRYASAAEVDADLARCADADQWTAGDARAFWGSIAESRDAPKVARLKA
jgi:serine/threonine-protein kinase